MQLAGQIHNRIPPPGKYKKYSITADRKSLTITKLKPVLDEGCYIAVVDLGDYTLRALFRLEVKPLPRKCLILSCLFCSPPAVITNQSLQFFLLQFCQLFN